MNQDQITNLVQSVGKIGGAIVGTYGAQASNLWVSGIGFVTAAIAFYFSHRSNATQPVANTAMPAIQRVSIVTLLCIGSALASGCKTTAGVAGLNVSGTFASGGKIVDAGVEVGSNSFTVDGLVSGIFGLGTNQVGGSVTVPVGTSTNK